MATIIPEPEQAVHSGAGTITLDVDNSLSDFALTCFEKPRLSYAISKDCKLVAKPKDVPAENQKGRAGIFGINPEPQRPLEAVSVYKIEDYAHVLIFYVNYMPNGQNQAKAAVYDDVNTSVGESLIEHVRKNKDAKSEIEHIMVNKNGRKKILVECKIDNSHAATATFAINSTKA